MEKASSFQLIRYLELLICIGQNNFKGASLLEFETEKKLGHYSGKLNKTFELTISINLAIALWLNFELKKSMKWIQKITKLKNCEARIDIQSFAYVFGAMVAADLKDSEILEKFVQIAYKPKRANVEMPSPYCQLIKLIGKLEFRPLKTQQLELIDEIKALCLSPEFPNQLGKDEIAIWIIHKTTQKPLIEIVKELGQIS